MCAKRPKSYHKYIPFNANTLSYLISGDIYYGNPKIFNDPLDCVPELKYDIQDVKILERLLRKLHPYDSTLEDVIDGSLINVEEKSKEPLHGSYAKALFLRGLKNQIKNIGVFSLSSDPNNSLLWSHYADNHRGVCISFGEAKKGYFKNERKPRIVDYEKPRIVSISLLNKSIIDEDTEAEKEIEDIIIFRKDNEWDYEKEWRVFSFKQGLEASNLPIKEVTFGLRCPLFVKATIIIAMANSPETIGFFEIKTKSKNLRVPLSEEYISGILKFFPILSTDQIPSGSVGNKLHPLLYRYLKAGEYF